MRQVGKGAIRWPVVVVLTSVATAATSMGPARAYVRPGVTTRASVASGGGQANYLIPKTGWSHGATTSDISANGRYVAFESEAPLVMGDTNLASDIFVHDLKTRETERVSISSQGLEGRCSGSSLGSGAADRPSISRTGRYVAFESDFCNLVPGDQNGITDVFVHDRKRKATTLVSVSSEGQQGRAWSGGPSISDNGRYVAFWSDNELIERDTNDARDTYVRDLETNRTELVSLGSDNRQAEQGSICSAISGDGRYVAFDTPSSLSSKDTNALFDVYLRDRKTDKTELISVGLDGNAAGGFDPNAASRLCNYGNEVSRSGRYVSFGSGASNIVPNDTGNSLDSFVADRKTRRMRRVSVTGAGEQRASDFFTAISPDGRYVAFASYNSFDPRDREAFASELSTVVSDRDVYLHDLDTGATELISVSSSNEKARNCPQDTTPFPPKLPFASNSSFPSVSAGGIRVSFMSCGDNVVADDTNLASDIFVRNRGIDLGVDGLDGGDASAPGDEPICVTPDICIPPGGSFAVTHEGSDISSALTQRGASLVGAAISFRPQHEDLYATIEVQDMPSLSVGQTERPLATASRQTLAYGLRFNMGDKSYEVRATSLLGGTFGLFDCTDSPLCTKIADLQGGYGTTGERVVFSLPLDEIGLDKGGKLSNAVAFSAFGTYTTGAMKILDQVPLS